jgi:hypothetical protein
MKTQGSAIATVHEPAAPMADQNKDGVILSGSEGSAFFVHP